MDHRIETPTEIEPKEAIRTATLERIRHFLQSPKDVHVYSDLRRLCTTVSVSYRNRSVLELLQNAHDAHASEETAGRIRFRLTEEGEHGTLYAANDGRGFTGDNFTALCSPTRTTKAVNEAIGNKGVGFLSVFQISSHPEVYSRSKATRSPSFGGFCFAFADAVNLRAFLDREGLAEQTQFISESMPQLYLATPLDEPPETVRVLGDEGYATVLRLPLKNAEARSAVEHQLEDLATGDPDVQLFLDRISELKIEVGEKTYELSRDVKNLFKQDDTTLQQVTCGERAYIVARRTLKEADVRKIIDADVTSEALPESWTEWRGDAIVSLAVTASGEPLKGRLYTFLPMGKDVEAPLSGHLDAPFFATIERKNVEEGGTLNPYLLAQCQSLAIDAAAIAKSVLAYEQARHVVVDLLVWTGPQAIVLRQRLLDDKEPLIPAETHRDSSGWSNLESVRAWDSGGFFSARRVAGVAAFALIDTKLGAARVLGIKKFVGGAFALSVTADQKADVVVALAQDLHNRNCPISEWDRYYAALPDLLLGAGARLQGRPILLTDRGDLAAAEGGASIETSKGRRRLSTVFLPARRSTAEPIVLPMAVQRRMTYLHGELACVLDGANPGRKFLTGASLVRDYDRREILRVMAGVIADPGQAKDPEQARWEALNAIMTICTSDGQGLADATEINLRLPTRGGWHRASEAFFGQWPGTRSDELDELFEKAAPVSEELRALSDLRLVPYGEWQVPAGKRDAWIKFLKHAGVRDHLRPILSIGGQPVRTLGHNLASALSSRSVAISIDQKKAWIAQLRRQETLINPNTEFTVRDAMRFPGQADYAEISKVAANAYAIQVIRMLEEFPNLASMIVFRPGHASAPNSRSWPSPAAAFLAFEHWLPIIGDARRQLGNSWLPSPTETPPPQAPLITHRVKTIIERSDRAREVLVELGLSIFGQPGSAWPLLLQASEWLMSSALPGDRLWSLTQDAWAKADLGRDLPVGLRLLAKVDGEVIAFDPRTEIRPVYVADAEDRTMVAALSRVARGVIIFEPPPTKAKEVASYLSARLPGRLQRMSEMDVVYRTPSETFVFDSLNPSIESEISGDLRSFVLLTVRYKCKFVSASPDTLVGKLSALRIKWVDELRLQLGSHQLEVPSFRHSAVLVSSNEGDTLLAPRSARGTDKELMVLAHGLGEAVASRSLASDAFFATASRMAQTGLGLTSQGLADALGLSPEDVVASMQDSRSVIGALVHVARPFIGLWSDARVLNELTDHKWSTEADMAAALDGLSNSPVRGVRLIEACRSGSVVSAALDLDVDLAALNNVLREIGPPYQIIDRTLHHQEGFTSHYVRHQARIRESFRRAYFPHFRTGNLVGYLAARSAAPPTIPPGVGHSLLRSTHTEWASWLLDWLKQAGTDSLVELPERDAALEVVRDKNLKSLKVLAPSARLIVVKRLGSDAEGAGFWHNPEGLEERLMALASARGWIDFDLLSEQASLEWLAREGLWSVDWPRSLAPADHGLTQGDIEALKMEERQARELRLNPPRTLAYSGGDIVFGQTSLASITDSISQLAESNTELLNSSSNMSGGIFPAQGGGGGRGGGGGGYGTSTTRITEEEKKVIGYFGEVIAFAWLKAKFGHKRIVDNSCWKSEYRFHACGERGDDNLGYDFEILSGRAAWYFEVKATSAADPGNVDMIELGSSEIAKAEVCRAENRSHYRILRVTNALRPEKATLTVLPNPRSVEGLKFFAEQKSTGVRLRFGFL
ncbi:sacsin N-terminal ATP-binding-like domain-containing protein [Rhizobium laguerreae]|uniref:sacsin N-terminal ATP-binding-like domain-containing protein n=1 Tax=Rhizobium laguerreae TaxID=1076926 RepID=UPI001C923640|nr:ATP-binding protein [Rhizobium laguerreae]MBY3315076.1 hypothetical protein [Rhizobium laguerreae]